MEPVQLTVEKIIIIFFYVEIKIKLYLIDKTTYVKKKHNNM